MCKVQEKLKSCIEKQSLKSLDRLADALDATTDDVADDEGTNDRMEEDALASSAIEASCEVVAGKGENKVLVSKRSKRKQKHSYRMKAIEKKRRIAEQQQGDQPKRKPRYHCAF